MEGGGGASGGGWWGGWWMGGDVWNTYGREFVGSRDRVKVKKEG
jgi:hypothetical protein